MALTFVTAIQSTTGDLQTSYLGDLTVYGGVNPARNELAVYVFLYKRDAQDNDTLLDVVNSNPLNAVSWSFTLPQQDGIFVALILAPLIWQAGTYAINSVVYYSGSVYKSNTSTSQTPGGGQWDLVTDLTTLVGNSTVQQAQTHNWSGDRARAGGIGDSMAAFGANYIQGKCKSWNEAGAVLTGAGLIESSFTNFRRLSYDISQEIMDFVDKQSTFTI